jgi:hypothetical protein
VSVWKRPAPPQNPASVAAFLLYSLQRSIINQENNLLLNAISGTANDHIQRVLHTSGTLSQNATGLNGTDAVITAAAAMRTNSNGFASPDLCITPSKHGGPDPDGEGKHRTVLKQPHVRCRAWWVHVEWWPEYAGDHNPRAGRYRPAGRPRW